MNETTKRLLYWSPRVLCIFFALLLGVFTLDVFSMQLSPWELVGALVLHLLPALIVLAILALVWRHEWIGAFLFPLLAIAYLALTWGRLHWIAYALISGPLLLVGVLFLVNWWCRVELRPHPR